MPIKNLTFFHDVQQLTQSEVSCQQFQSHISECQLVLTMFEITHRIDLGKVLRFPPDAIFAMEPQITSVCVCVPFHLNWLKNVTFVTKHKLRIQ